jgi:signal transduction histidine kinase
MERKRLLSFLVIVILTVAASAFMIYQIKSTKAQQISLIEKSLIQEAVAHFDNMLMTRRWNAEHGGVYVKQHDDLQPNPYLKDNILYSERNETLIKINPAWMTRQISEISNVNSDYYYKITSLNPINPGNRADSFEREALSFFEKNRDVPYYWRFAPEKNKQQRFDFMGALKVGEVCMKCHAYQGYQVGDIRGGIRVSVPMENFNQSVALHEEKALKMTAIVVGMSLVALIVITALVFRVWRYHETLEAFNEELEHKVDDRTRQLRDLNEHLEERVQQEVMKNKENEEYLLAQSRHAAMGEMIGMLAHQWRQPISVIAMGANNLLVDIELGNVDNESLKNELLQIVGETKNLSLMIDEFRKHFEGEDSAARTPLTEMADEVLHMLHGSLEYHAIDISRSYDEAVNDVAYSRELIQVYLHLLNNAKEALVKCDVTPKRLSFSIYEEQGTIVSHIVNYGCEIDEEDVNRLFDPYFSTKAAQNEVGLGLYISKIIIEKHFNGRIALFNDAEGVCSEVRFPR